MTLKRKIDKAAFEALSDETKGHYKEKDGSYFLEADDAAGLESALEAQKAKNTELSNKLAELSAKLDEINQQKQQADADKNRKNRDYDALEADYNRKIDELKAKNDEAQANLRKQIEKMLVDNKALSIANEVFGENAEIMLPHIKNRLQANFDGSEPTTRVLDAKGQPSANSIEELQKEFLDNPRYAHIVVGTRGSGGNANGSQGAGGNAADKKPEDMSEAERVALYRSNPERFKQLFPNSY